VVAVVQVEVSLRTCNIFSFPTPLAASPSLSRVPPHLFLPLLLPPP